ncbi:MAG: 2-amino-4-hydroxy-6-hydroxymethyldihydropteridine diphosphokinase [Caulobacterales bacterium]|nr:2-amino-4-hydroxy-6-hydroxymethyldihydropteridine diphosphokinase [Caulobacterales bacterium]
MNGSEWDQAVVIALGSNLKGPFASTRDLLEAALGRFAGEGLAIIHRSSWWRSDAWPDPSAPPFLNGVVIVETELGPRETLSALHRIEAAFGRDRHTPNAPRTLDLDLIAYGREAGMFDGLVLPHPRAAERRFVMGPLAEIAPDWRCPVTGERAEAKSARAEVGLDANAV